MWTAQREVVRQSGLEVVLQVSDRGHLRWLLHDLVSDQVMGVSHNAADATAWVHAINNQEWWLCWQRVAAAEDWARLVIRDQDIVLHNAPGSCSGTCACGQ